MDLRQIVLDRVVPLLETGVRHGRIELDKDDCDALLFVLKTSVSLEPFLDLFSKILKETVINEKASTKEELKEVNR
jgi:hypothetical protein